MLHAPTQGSKGGLAVSGEDNKLPQIDGASLNVLNKWFSLINTIFSTSSSNSNLPPLPIIEQLYKQYNIHAAIREWTKEGYREEPFLKKENSLWKTFPLFEKDATILILFTHPQVAESSSYFFEFLYLRALNYLYGIILLSYFWSHIWVICKTGKVTSPYLSTLEQIICSLCIPFGGRLYVSFKVVTLRSLDTTNWKPGSHIDLELSAGEALVLQKHEVIHKFFHSFIRKDLEEALTAFAKMSYEEKIYSWTLRKKITHKLISREAFNVKASREPDNPMINYIFTENSLMSNSLEERGYQLVMVKAGFIDLSTLDSSQSVRPRDILQDRILANDSKMTELINFSDVLFHSKIVNVLLFGPSESGYRCDYLFTHRQNLYSILPERVRISFDTLANACIDWNAFFAFDETTRVVSKVASAYTQAVQIYQEKVLTILSKVLPYNNHGVATTLLVEKDFHQKAEEIDTILKSLVDEANSEQKSTFHTVPFEHPALKRHSIGEKLVHSLTKIIVKD